LLPHNKRNWRYSCHYLRIITYSADWYIVHHSVIASTYPPPSFSSLCMAFSQLVGALCCLKHSGKSLRRTVVKFSASSVSCVPRYNVREFLQKSLNQLLLFYVEYLSHNSPWNAAIYGHSFDRGVSQYWRGR
jgi:hypothetical protein